MEDFMSYYTRRKIREIKAVLFGVTLCAMLLSSLVIAFVSTGPIVLGTEMNTDGQVEYLCLFGGCERTSLF